jgi:hypothetical protein
MSGSAEFTEYVSVPDPYSVYGGSVTGGSSSPSSSSLFGPPSDIPPSSLYPTSYDYGGGSHSNLSGEEGSGSSPAGTSTSSWLLVIFLSALIVITIVGNILVCLAVILVRKLRKPQNYLLVSLATSDLFVALFVMPFAIVAEFHENQWPLNPALCDLWVSGK